MQFTTKKGFILSILTIFFAFTAKSQSGYIDRYVSENITLKDIGANVNGISKPRDLDFKPNTNELWVSNNGGSNGGSMVIIYNAGLSNQSGEYRKDSHSGHFMIYPSAFAFGEDGFFANNNEILSTAGLQSTFMGPALWSSDTAIFATVFQSDWGNGLPLGSHYDMLHQSPYSMGIAHDSALVYWVNDGHNGNICKYDFVKHHGPGYDNHSAGKIWRYTDVPVTRVANIPSHMVLDKSSGWLYFIDGGSKKVNRLNTKSGDIIGTLKAPSSGLEPLSGYWEVGGSTVEELDTYDTQPCGIDILDNRLIVSDHTTGDIYLYSVDDSGITLLKTIVTGHPGMMGVKFGPDSKIWCVNNADDKVYRLDISNPKIDVALISIDGPAIQNFMPNFYSTAFNICENKINPTITILNKGTDAITDIEFEYTIDDNNSAIFSWSGNVATGISSAIELPSINVDGGSHLLKINATKINGESDDVTQNNNLTGSFRISTKADATGFTEDFGGTVFPPEGWNYIHYNPNNIMSKGSVGGFGNSSTSLKMDNFSGQENISGQIDYIMSPSIDFSSSATATLSFSVAYAQYNASTNDKLQLFISTDCGNSWTNVYEKEGKILSTSGNPVTSNWKPTSTQWRSESIDLSQYAGFQNVILMYTTTNNFGNNLYLDDIKIDNTLGNSKTNNSKELFTVYPNPTNGLVELVVSDEIAGNEFQGKIYSNSGQLIRDFSVPENGKTIQLDLSNLPSGMFIIELSNKKLSFKKSIIKQ